MVFQEWTNSQRRVYLDTAQVYEAFTDAYRKSRSFRRGMHWKKSKGREYLFRTLDRNGYGKSLGPHSPETEQILERFQQNKQAIKERLAAVKTRLAEQARFCKAARLDRVPRLVTGILRLLEQQGILGKNILLVGTHAMFAYEVAAGIFLDSPILATGDIDLLWGVRPPLKLVGDETIRNEGLLGILKQADRDNRKKTREGLAVARLTLQYLPDYPFAPSELRMFPKDVASEGISAFSVENDLPVGFDLPED